MFLHVLHLTMSNRGRSCIDTDAKSMRIYILNFQRQRISLLRFNKLLQIRVMPNKGNLIEMNKTAAAIQASKHRRKLKWSWQEPKQREE